MRTTILLAFALALPAALAAPAAADHIVPGFQLTTWCSYLAPEERGCVHSESFTNQHVHWFGVTPRLGVSLPEGSVVEVRLTGTTLFGQPFTAGRTCDLGVGMFTPQPTLPHAGLDARLQRELGDASLHESCRVDIHTNFRGEVTLTATSGEGLHGLVDAWVSLL